MIYSSREKLTIFDIGGIDEIAFSELEKVLMIRPSNIIYCENNGKLDGKVISTTSVKNMIENFDYDEIKKYVPITTLSFLV